MVDSRYTVALITLALFFTLNCKLNREDRYVNFHDNKFHWILYTDPSKDCIGCIVQALAILDSGMEKSLPLKIFMQKSGDTEHFKVYIQDQLKGRDFEFFEKDFKFHAPHPSILLIRNKGIYMYFFIYNDPFLFNEYFTKCRELFLNSKL